ncbi:MAG: hypothetical protein IT373_34295 [Polyangiaceae bacterium]|nr:hypothetical protein [Polyangiaceae bacterium]
MTHAGPARRAAGVALAALLGALAGCADPSPSEPGSTADGPARGAVTSSAIAAAALPAACSAYFRALDCLGAKMPGASGASMRDNAVRMRAVLARPGSDAAAACANALPTLAALLPEHGCQGSVGEPSASPAAR